MQLRTKTLVIKVLQYLKDVGMIRACLFLRIHRRVPPPRAIAAFK